MRKKRLLHLLTATLVIVSLSGCKSDTSSNADTNTAIAEITSATTSVAITENTTTPQAADIGIETLAEGEKRDYKVEDILKNDLEIDGIPITIPCTLSELLDTLGKDYSVAKSSIKNTISGEINSKFNDFTGEFVVGSLCYKGEYTLSTIHALIADPKKINYDDIYVIGFFSNNGRHNGYLNFPNISKGDSLAKCLQEFGAPNEVILSTDDENSVYLSYYDYDNNGNEYCFLQINIRNGTVYRAWVEFRTEDL